MERQHLSQTKNSIAPPQTQSHAIARHSPHPIEELQGAIGNQAVNKFLVDRPTVQAKPMFRGLSGELVIQPKLTIGEVGDKYEQEADRAKESEEQTETKTELPANLKAGIEIISGVPMDDVKVHYSSPKPAQMQALAYAQGSNIYLGPGQKQHLPHEAWHVVQQKQGRVKAIDRVQGYPVNDDSRLEREADSMAALAEKTSKKERGHLIQNDTEAGKDKTQQGITNSLSKTIDSGEKSVIQRVIVEQKSTKTQPKPTILNFEQAMKELQKRMPNRLEKYQEIIKEKIQESVKDQKNYFLISDLEFECNQLIISIERQQRSKNEKEKSINPSKTSLKGKQVVSIEKQSAVKFLGDDDEFKSQKNIVKSKHGQGVKNKGKFSEGKQEVKEKENYPESKQQVEDQEETLEDKKIEKKKPKYRTKSSLTALTELTAEDRTRFGYELELGGHFDVLPEYKEIVEKNINKTLLYHKEAKIEMLIDDYSDTKNTVQIEFRTKPLNSQELTMEKMKQRRTKISNAIQKLIPLLNHLNKLSSKRLDEYEKLLNEKEWEMKPEFKKIAQHLTITDLPGAVTTKKVQHVTHSLPLERFLQLDRKEKNLLLPNIGNPKSVIEIIKYFYGNLKIVVHNNTVGGKTLYIYTTGRTQTSPNCKTPLDQLIYLLPKSPEKTKLIDETINKDNIARVELGKPNKKNEHWGKISKIDDEKMPSSFELPILNTTNQIGYLSTEEKPKPSLVDLNRADVRILVEHRGGALVEAINNAINGNFLPNSPTVEQYKSIFQKLDMDTTKGNDTFSHLFEKNILEEKIKGESAQIQKEWQVQSSSNPDSSSHQVGINSIPVSPIIPQNIQEIDDTSHGIYMKGQAITNSKNIKTEFVAVGFYEEEYRQDDGISLEQQAQLQDLMKQALGNPSYIGQTSNTKTKMILRIELKNINEAKKLFDLLVKQLKK